MMDGTTPRGCVLAVAGCVLAVVVISMLGPCQSKPDVNQELAQTARTAVEMARDGQQANDAAYLAPGRLRMIAVAVGVAVPIVVAAVLVYLVMKRRPDDLELFAEIEVLQKRLGCDQGHILRHIPSGTAGEPRQGLPTVADRSRLPAGGGNERPRQQLPPTASPAHREPEGAADPASTTVRTTTEKENQ
jgi:hypothetical protein